MNSFFYKKSGFYVLLFIFNAYAFCNDNTIDEVTLSEAEKSEVRAKAIEKIKSNESRIEKFSIPSEQKKISDAVVEFNRSHNDSSEDIIRTVLDSSSNNPYKKLVLQKLVISDRSLPIFFDFLENNRDRELRGTAVINLRSKIEIPEVYQLIKSLAEDPEEFGWVRKIANASIANKGSLAGQKNLDSTSRLETQESVENGPSSDYKEEKMQHVKDVLKSQPKAIEKETVEEKIEPNRLPWLIGILALLTVIGIILRLRKSAN